MYRTYLLLGSNIGDRIQWLAFARNHLLQGVGLPVALSSIYTSEAWGMSAQASFLNQAIALDTQLSPESLLRSISAIENIAGRQRDVHWGPRTLDIDILFYDQLILHTDRLTIPHAHLHERNFALIPLLEIAPELTHPVFGISIQELYLRSPDRSEVSILAAR